MYNYIMNIIKKYHVSLILLLIYYILSNQFFGYFCPSQVIFGLPCPACGMSRAFMALLAFDIRKSFYYHPMVFFVVPLLAVYFYYKIKKPEKVKKLFYPALIIILLSFVLFAVRLLNAPGQEPLEFNRHNILNIFNRNVIDKK